MLELVVRGEFAAAAAAAVATTDEKGPCVFVFPKPFPLVSAATAAAQ